MNLTSETIARKGLLLHSCCAPCSAWPLENLLERGIVPQLYFYNPNIHPLAEWQRRYESMIDFAAHHELTLHVSREWDESVWRKLGRSEKRCRFCYGIRMKHAAAKAAELGLGCFTSSLLVSPYQNRELILQAGRTAARMYGVEFLEEDWRERFRYGQQLAKEEGLYRQKYCACCISLEDSEFREKITRRQEAFTPREETPSLSEMRPISRE